MKGGRQFTFFAIVEFRERLEMIFTYQYVFVSFCVLSGHAINLLQLHSSESIFEIYNYGNSSKTSDAIFVHRPHLPINKNYRRLSFEPSVFMCNQKNSNICWNKTTKFREKILRELRTSMVNLNGNGSLNNAKYMETNTLKRNDVKCLFLNANVRHLTNNDPPFDTQDIGHLFPKRNLFEEKYSNESKSCAIVSSAGSLNSSGLGKFIGTYTVKVIHVINKALLNDVTAMFKLDNMN